MFRRRRFAKGDDEHAAERPWGLSAEMAIRFEKAFGMKADTMLLMQAAYDLAQARAREGDILVDRIVA